MRKLLLVSLILFMVSQGLGLEASLVTEDGDSPKLDFDRETNLSNFFDGFPSDFAEPESLGSFSFRDQSIVNPNLFLNISGDNESLGGERIQIYYASPSGNETYGLLPRPAYISNFSGNSTLIDLDFSAFRSMYPGKLHVGFAKEEVTVTRTVRVNNTTNTTENFTELQGPFNLTRIDSTFMEGNYTITPSIQSVQGQTEITVSEVYDADGNEIHRQRDLSTPLIVTVERDEEVIDTKKLGLKESGTLNFSFIGGEKVYVNGILSLQTKSVSGCETINERDFYYLLNESSFNTDTGSEDSCLEISNVSETIVDFANNTVDGDGNSSFENNRCALSVSNTEGVTLKNPRVQQFARGICVEDSTDTLITGRSSRENNLGIYLNNSTANIRDISLKNQDAEIDALEDSTANMSKVNFETAEISGIGNDIRMKNVFNPPPDPDQAVNISQWINITKTDSNGNIVDLGFHYPSLSDSNINPLFMYKFDLMSGGSTNSTNGTGREWSYQNLSIVKQPTERIILRQGQIDNFSVFGVYGERIQGNGTGNNPGEGAGDNQNGTGSQGGSQDPGSGQATGGAGGGIRPEPEPEPVPVELNLSLTDNSLSIQQGETGRVNFSVENIGEVDSPPVYVEAETRLGWQSGRQDFEEINTGDTQPGNILLDVYDSEVTGTYSVPVEVRSISGSTLDTEFLEVEVLPRRELRDISVVEAPTFLNLESSDSEQLGFLIENSGDYDLENVTLDVRNAGSCIENTGGSHDFEIGERKNVEYTLTTGSQEATCTGVFVFNSQNGENLGINPVRISVAEPTLIERLTTNILPALFLVWTLFTVYWVRRRFYER